MPNTFQQKDNLQQPKNLSFAQNRSML